ncbi:hypothetical protein GCM10023318_48250 [Nocardia callitridis]|uniref:Uncharacterized protein n=1 Tax=Nocardia callitridis TaxID=648753 RepID=A0ABP9KPX8_9NOCA
MTANPIAEHTVSNSSAAASEGTDPPPAACATAVTPADSTPTDTPRTTAGASGFMDAEYALLPAVVNCVGS